MRKIFIALLLIASSYASANHDNLLDGSINKDNANSSNIIVAMITDVVPFIDNTDRERLTPEERFARSTQQAIETNKYQESINTDKEYTFRDKFKATFNEFVVGGRALSEMKYPKPDKSLPRDDRFVFSDSFKKLARENALSSDDERALMEQGIGNEQEFYLALAKLERRNKDQEIIKSMSKEKDMFLISMALLALAVLAFYFFKVTNKSKKSAKPKEKQEASISDFERAKREYLGRFNKRYKEQLAEDKLKKKKELDDFFRKKDADGNILEDDNECINEKCVKLDEYFSQQDSETTRRAKEATLRLLRKSKSPGLFSTIKYSKFLLKADTRFKDVYNFNMLNENKTEANLNILAFTVLFEEMRNNRKLPDEMEAIVYSIHDKCIFKPHLCPGGAELVDIEMYKILYSLYNQHRVRGEIPALAMVFAFYEAEENPLSKEDMKRFREEYSMSPIFTLD